MPETLIGFTSNELTTLHGVSETIQKIADNGNATLDQIMRLTPRITELNNIIDAARTMALAAAKTQKV